MCEFKSQKTAWSGRQGKEKETESPVYIYKIIAEWFL